MLKKLVLGCPECSVRLIAPICSEHVTERHVRHSWSCENCGHRFVTSDHLSFRQTTISRDKVQSSLLLGA